MKNIINYAYNLQVENIESFNEYAHFIMNEKSYYFVPFNRSNEDINDIINCSKDLKLKGIDCHDIILNKENQIFTKHGENFYILLKVNGNEKKEYFINDILNINKKIILNKNKIKLYSNNWANMWSSKIDYFEYQVREYGKTKEGILNSFSYYIGLAENAISYANKTSSTLTPNDLDKVTLAHRRIFYPNIKLNYLNPLSFIIDLEIRDVAEYIKSLFFCGQEEEALIELDLYLKLKALSGYGYQMLYARLLYPSYYFDIYERVMINACSEDELIKIISKEEKYEKFLYETFKLISKYYNIEPIYWINKKEVINQHL